VKRNSQAKHFISSALIRPIKQNTRKKADGTYNEGRMLTLIGLVVIGKTSLLPQNQQ
jgi:hypothetical protein